MKLKRGTRFSLDVTKDANGYVLTPCLYVGDRLAKRLGKATRCRTAEDLYTEIEIFAQTRLAQIGLEKTK